MPTPKPPRKALPAPKPEPKVGKALVQQKAGRPSIYTHELGIEIAQRIADGQSLTTIAKQAGMPNVRTLLEWAASNGDFAHVYARGCEARALKVAEEALEIADAPSADSTAAQDKRVRVDTRKWLAAKWYPKQFGDRVQTELTGKVDVVAHRGEQAKLERAIAEMTDEQLDVLAEFYAKAGIKLPGQES